MFSEEALKKARKQEEEWRRSVSESYEKKLGFELPRNRSESGIPLKPVYTPCDLEGAEVEMPGAYPYTRAGNPITYQYMPWMIQMLHGYGTSEETRERTEFLIREGMTGYGGQKVVLIQVDPPTTCGYDPDAPRVKGMVGLTGASISTLEDLHTLLSGYDLSKTRMAPNNRFSCLPMLAMYLVYAEGKGYKPSQLNGQSQNDAPTRFITTDIGAPTLTTQHKLRMELIKYCTENMPRWNHTNLCGYLYGEMCATPAQELGIVLAQAVQLVQDGIRIGLNPDDFVPRFSSQVHLGMDFFEEVAKLRAWRRMWARMMRERFKCKDPRSLQYRIHVQTGGSTLTSQQPLNNIARTTLQVLASVLGGVQSLHTASYDEAIGLPSEEAVRTAIRVNQVILHESRVAHVTDPLGGSYYVEWLTNKVEEEAAKVLADIEARGGFNKCIESGWLRQLLERQVVRWRQEIDSGERVVVGLNKFTLAEREGVPPFTMDQAEIERKAVERVRRWRAERDSQKALAALQGVREAMQGFQSLEQTGILMPALIEAARAKCTIGEMMEAIVGVSGGRVYST
ncbi:MAG: acyl-CoA mutase large subunit family protein [Chloroflexota bacterium]